MRKSKKVLSLLLVMLMVCLAMAGCGSKDNGDDGGDTGDAVKNISVLVPNADHGWTGAVLNYAKEKQEEVNAEGKFNIDVKAATDAKAQQEMVDDLLAGTAPDGVVILPYDNTMESSVLKLAEADIPFIMFDRIIDNEAVQSKVIANVKGDNEGIGKATADRFVEKGLKPGDKVYVMIGDTSSVPEMRNKGFQDGLKAAGWTDDQLAGIEYSAATNWSRADGKKLFTDWINGKSVDEIAQTKYIFTHDDEIAMGILEALAGTEIDPAKKDAFTNNVVCLASSSGLNEMYQVLKGEHSNTAFPALIEKMDLFSVTYDPAMIKQAIDDMIAQLNGETVSKDHTIEVHVVDKTNVNDYQGF